MGRTVENWSSAKWVVSLSLDTHTHIQSVDVWWPHILCGESIHSPQPRQIERQKVPCWKLTWAYAAPTHDHRANHVYIFYLHSNYVIFFSCAMLWCLKTGHSRKRHHYYLFDCLSSVRMSSGDCMSECARTNKQNGARFVNLFVMFSVHSFPTNKRKIRPSGMIFKRDHRYARSRTKEFAAIANGKIDALTMTTKTATKMDKWSKQQRKKNMGE